MSLHCIVWCCMVLYCWLWRAGCISQDTYLLYYFNLWHVRNIQIYLQKYTNISWEIHNMYSTEIQNMYSGCFDIPCQKYCRPGPAGTETPSLLILSENFNNPPYTWQIYLQSIIQLYKYITEFEKYQYMANISTNTNIYLYTNLLSTNISANIYAKYDY